jgi:DNA-binding MarR family transcriptional regulator
LATCPLPQFRIPKFERLKRLAERYLGPDLDAGGMEAYLLLVSLAKELFEIGTANLAKYGLGEGRCSVLVLLLESQPEPLSHSQLADLLGVTKGSITGLVDGLEHDGYVRREDRDEDRRLRLISLTPAGLEVVERALPEKFRNVAGLMSRLTPAERTTLVSLLLKVQEGLPDYRGE